MSVRSEIHFQGQFRGGELLFAFIPVDLPRARRTVGSRKVVSAHRAEMPRGIPGGFGYCRFSDGGSSPPFEVGTN